MWRSAVGPGQQSRKHRSQKQPITPNDKTKSETMDHADLYQKNNSLQRCDAKQTIDEFGHLLRWHPDGGDSLLDIGCGSGDVLVDYLMPLLPANYKRVVGVDVSHSMLRHARDTYAVTGDGRLTFEYLDAGRPLKDTLNINTEWLSEPFDHVTSFYCLHWLPNQQQALQNVYDMLRPGGDCLLVFLALNPLVRIFDELCKMKRWKGFVADMQKSRSPYQYSECPADELGERLDAAGFGEYDVQVLEKEFLYNGTEVLRKSLRAVLPFLDRMDVAMQESFLDDYVTVLGDLNLAQPKAGNEHVTQFRSHHKLFVAYARK